MIKNISKYKIHEEQSKEFIEKWFTSKQHQFINHIDTLYYVVYPDVQDWNSNTNARKLVDYLSATKDKIMRNIKPKPLPIFEDINKNLEMMPFMGFQMYSLHFGLDDNFDVFVMPKTLNKNTPPIFVQIRSYSLWLDGSKQAFDKSVDCVKNVLKKFDIPIQRVQENRIDYAFHTNRIQDFMNFFSEQNLVEMQVSNFERSQKQYYFRQDEIFADYFTLGRRTSNNVFFRVYDKTKEVIEMGYKQFFIQIWLKHGLINKFDEFILKRTFTYGSYNSKEKARCEFYLTYGKDFGVKQDIKQLLSNTETSYQSYKKIADKVVPDITTIVNIEFQTKRKFYARLNIPVVTEDASYKKNMYNLFEQINAIILKLTTDTIRFVKYKGEYLMVRRAERPPADWWVRLQKSKTIDIECDKWLIDYIRKYQSELSFERQKKVSLKTLSSVSAFLTQNENDDILTDFKNLLPYINDNDIVNYKNNLRYKEKELRKRGLI